MDKSKHEYYGATRNMLFAVAMLVAACTSGPQIQTTVDPEVRVTEFRTFTFLESAQEGAERTGNATVRERLRRMIGERMASRGYLQATLGSNADLGVHFTGQLVARQRAVPVGRPDPSEYAWGPADLGGDDTLDYRDGTFVIDIVQLRANRLAWRARISETFTSDYSEQNWERFVAALQKAFEQLPRRS